MAREKHFNPEAETAHTGDSPTTVAEESQGVYEQDRAEANRTTRPIGVNSNGEPTLYPSDVEAVSTQYGLTGPEAERLITEGDVSEAAADRIRSARGVYRLSYERITGARAVGDEGLAVDDTVPTAGPYGPNVEYEEVTVPADRDHAAVTTAVTSEVTDEVANVGRAS